MEMGCHVTVTIKPIQQSFLPNNNFSGLSGKKRNNNPFILY